MKKSERIRRIKQFTIAEGKKNLSSSFIENSNSGTLIVALFSKTSFRIKCFPLGIGAPDTRNLCRFIKVNLSLKSRFRTAFLSEKSIEVCDYETFDRFWKKVPKEERNPSDPIEKGKIGGQGALWKMEEMCRRDPSPPHEIINCASFKCVSVSSSTKFKFEGDLRTLEGRRNFNFCDVSN